METPLPSAPDSPVRRSRRRAAGVACYLIGCVLSVVSVAVAFAAFDQPRHWLAGAIVATVLLLIAVAVLVAAEHFFVPSVADVLAHDARPPVVYLRPFGEDEALTYDVISTGETTTAITAKAEDFLLALNAIGPLVSIAEPNRWARLGMHPHGAYRDFVGEGDWQARVQTWLDQAGMVVLAMGDSPGIEWEIQQVRQRVGPQSLLLYLPPRPADAFTRKGRHKKEQAIYEHFRALVEKHFGLTMPPFTESTYLIGFDADGTPVMAPDAPRKRWAFTEHGRVADAIRSQLGAVLAKVRPDAQLDTYQIAGRPGLWARTIAATTLILTSIGIGLLSGLAGPVASLALQALPGLMLTAGWVLLARYFGKPWVWIVPIALGISVALNFGVQAYAQIDPEAGYMLLRSPWYQLAGSLVHWIYVGAVLTLGVALAGRRAGDG
ncbi:MAG: hypothetical protein FHP94_13995 [Denitromonas halophila]|nr:MAG: hypothetical protein FHP94_13995 [Denitromonas halophila]TVT66786.1 MAG: hypothetical protein FHP93_18355 [Denitromonas halophila]